MSGQHVIHLTGDARVIVEDTKQLVHNLNFRGLSGVASAPKAIVSRRIADINRP